MAEAAESSGGRGFPILVSLPPLPSPPAPAKLERKIEKYFQSKGESGGGECNVSGTGNPQIYRVSFVNKEDRENVLRRKEHSIQMNGSELRLSVKEEDGRREIQFNSSQTSLENMEAEAYSERGNEPPRVSQTVAPPGEEISPQWDSSREVPTISSTYCPHFALLICTVWVQQGSVLYRVRY
ncbi:hypothetical protein XENTR_v10024978 [Xenopus tropicalis]|nr:hypothetical protein XENTR_v10024978 [Xenopus tropicalis]